MARKIKDVMTIAPHTIGIDQPLTMADEMMREFRIRHLPVQKRGALVGIITDRDVKLASTFEGIGKLRVEDVMLPDPYTVQEDASLGEVAKKMAEHKLGCAIVLDSAGKVSGIFTAVDGLRLLAESLS